MWPGFCRKGGSFETCNRDWTRRENRGAKICAGRDVAGGVARGPGGFGNTSGKRFGRGRQIAAESDHCVRPFVDMHGPKRIAFRGPVDATSTRWPLHTRSGNARSAASRHFLRCWNTFRRPKRLSVDLWVANLRCNTDPRSAGASNSGLFRFLARLTQAKNPVERSSPRQTQRKAADALRLQRLRGAYYGVTGGIAA